MNRFNLHGKIVLGFIGSFYHFEGLEFLVQAFSTIKKNNLVLLLVGSGEKFTAVHDLVRKLGIQDKIILPGRVCHDEVNRYYSVMDIMVYPRLSKRITELVTPLKPLEAMAMGKCVLASNVGGHLELIADDAHGFFFEKENPQDLCDNIIKLITNKRHCLQAIQKAKKYVSSEKTWSKSIAKYIHIYNHTIPSLS